MRLPWLLWLLLIGGVIGLVTFGVLVAKSLDLEELSPSAAATRMDTARAAWPAGAERFSLGASGQLSRRARPSDSRPDPGTAGDPGEAEQLWLLAYHEGRLVEGHVPFWFLRLKEPAIRLIFAETGFDPIEAGWTVADLTAGGPGLLLDTDQAIAQRLIVWTE